MNPLDLVELPHRSLPNLELGHWIVGFADSIQSHPDLQDEDAIPIKVIPGQVELRALGNDFIAVTTAAQYDKNKAAERDAMRANAELLPTMTINWLVIKSLRENRPRILSHLRLQMKKRPTRGSGPTVTAPQNPKAKHGKVAGSALITCPKVLGAVIYHVWICQGDPTIESNWREAVQSRTCRGIEVPGLTPGEVYQFRINCFGNGGFSPFSAVVSLRIL